MPLAAQIIDADALLKVMAISVVAGGGLTVLFSILILTATRSAEQRRAGSAIGAALLGAVAVLAGLGCVALVALGINIMITK